MSIKAWPFLISRNKTLDYGVIVAPEIVGKRDFSKLISSTNGEITKPGVNVWRRMSGVGDQTLTLVFRIEQAWINGDRARDGFGRLIVQITGFISEGSQRETPVADEVFETLAEEVHSAYLEFWNRSEHAAVMHSEQLHVKFDERSRSLILAEPGESRFPVTKSSSAFNITEIFSTLMKRLTAFFRSL